MPRETVKAALDWHARRIISLPGVVGIAEGENGGKPCIRVFVAKKTERVLSQIPSDLEGWPVVVEESGRLQAFSKHADSGRKPL